MIEVKEQDLIVDVKNLEDTNNLELNNRPIIGSNNDLAGNIK